MHISDSIEGVDWAQAKADLAADDFDNGRSPEALYRSFESSQHVAVARDGDRVVGMARLLSDGVCNAYLLDVWTLASYRRRGIASSMVRLLADAGSRPAHRLANRRCRGVLQLARLPAAAFIHVRSGRHLARQRRQPPRAN